MLVHLLILIFLKRVLNSFKLMVLNSFGNKDELKGGNVNSVPVTGCFIVICKSVLLQDTGRELLPTDIKYYQMFGGEKVL